MIYYSHHFINMIIVQTSPTRFPSPSLHLHHIWKSLPLFISLNLNLYLLNPSLSLCVHLEKVSSESIKCFENLMAAIYFSSLICSQSSFWILQSILLLLLQGLFHELSIIMWKRNLKRINLCPLLISRKVMKFSSQRMTVLTAHVYTTYYSSVCYLAEMFFLAGLPRG